VRYVCRVVQFNLTAALTFLFDEIPVRVPPQITLSFISIRVIDNRSNEVRNEEGCGAINSCYSVLLAVGVTADAQQPTKIPRIGYLSTFDLARESARAEGVRLALRELGYIEGQTSPPSTGIRRQTPIGS